MPILDRYMLLQSTKAFGFFSVIILSIIWLSRIVTLLDRTAGNGYSVAVLFELTLLVLPGIMALILPFSSLAATLYSTNRLMHDHELLAMMAGGLSPMRLARPVLLFGVGATLILALLTNIITPQSWARFNSRGNQISQALVASLLREGEFAQPIEGVTIYVNKVSSSGLLQNIFISDTRKAEQNTTITAQRAEITQGPTSLALVLFSGNVQLFDTQNGTLSIVRFDNLVYDFASLLQNAASDTAQSLGSQSTTVLLSQLRKSSEEERQSLLYEINLRFSHPLLALGAALIGFSVLMTTQMNRFGLWPQIVLSVLMAGVVHLINIQSISKETVAQLGWPIMYMGPLSALVIGGAFLIYAQKLTGYRRKAKTQHPPPNPPPNPAYNGG